MFKHNLAIETGSSTYDGFPISLTFILIVEFNGFVKGEDKSGLGNRVDYLDPIEKWKNVRSRSLVKFLAANWIPYHYHFKRNDYHPKVLPTTFLNAIVISLMGH